MSQTQHLIDLAKRHMMAYSPPPLVLARGSGSTVWDADGNSYLDFAGGIGVNQLGHCHPSVSAAIAKQAAQLCHTSNSFYQTPYIELCTKLSQLCFGSHVFLSNSGTEANEAALKLARRHFHLRGEKRTAFVAMEHSFHGRTYGSLSVTGQPNYHEGFEPLLPNVRFAKFGDVDSLATCLGADTAAVIVEPILGNGGVLVPPPGYLQKVRDLCQQNGCLLIFDEVQTGMGRTGQWFAHQWDNVDPDIMTVAKALGGGLPLGGLIVKEVLSGVLKPGSHASTFGGNPVACAAGLATIQTIEKEHLLDNARNLGEKFQRLLHLLSDSRPEIKEIRGRGMMIGVELSREAQPALVACRDRGLLLTLAGKRTLRFLPPLNATFSDIERAVELLDGALGDSST